MDSEDRSMLFLLCCLFGGLGFLTVKLLKWTWEISKVIWEVAKWTGAKLWNGAKWTGVKLREGYKVLKNKWDERQARKVLAKEKPDLNQETDKVPLLKDEQVPELQPIWVVAQQQNSVGVSDKQVDDKKSMKDAITGAVKTSIDTKNSLTNGFQINNGRSEIAHQI
ncbi:hypothetical protein G9L34_002636 [Enterococcus hirae]|uniref:Uncharacterized protein n=1 Tax=Enterococcus hirae TaxID=1354 RepID=A0AB37I7A5_ENTHR|nr:hypothetical protein [Enterococcus hirae]EMF0151768.1 hypothetical protein [Enterococcus hirae]EMF0243101.1 hypothetical protein [Enterococcus hirae]EMF0383493.1 hypothetical protein [Enterococcus hirae]EMF0425419.1 hypothetical protein [Enterococcus hirae]EMF0532447.1 hypothetical protein [Enterococcus hirae]